MSVHEPQASIRTTAAQTFMEEHYATIGAITDVATALGVPYESLRKEFARTMGIPMNTYLHRVRMNAAKDLLHKGGMKLYAIAREVGYSDEIALIRHWKQTFGNSPSQYRTANGLVREPELIYVTRWSVAA